LYLVRSILKYFIKFGSVKNFTYIEPVIIRDLAKENDILEDI